MQDTPAALYRDGEAQIERGRPNIVVDAIGTVFSIPSKILLLNLSIDNHFVSSNTEQALVTYLSENNLTAPKVRINQYAPGAEFSRLVRNKRVGWGWRYTIGLVSWVVYTVLPQRIFGGDYYNPWSDTINIDSDHAAVVIHEGGHSKDFAQRQHPGFYAFLYMIPFVSLYHEAHASSDTLSYFRAENDTQKMRDGYKILYPAYATYVGGNMGKYVLPYTWLPYAAVIPGHIVGRIKAARVPASFSKNNGTTASQLKQLEELKEMGILTTNEFELKRKDLIETEDATEK